jgi:hypothetical protein
MVPRGAGCGEGEGRKSGVLHWQWVEPVDCCYKKGPTLALTVTLAYPPALSSRKARHYTHTLILNFELDAAARYWHGPTERGWRFLNVPKSSVVHKSALID